MGPLGWFEGLDLNKLFRGTGELGCLSVSKYGKSYTDVDGVWNFMYLHHCKDTTTMYKSIHFFQYLYAFS